MKSQVDKRRREVEFVMGDLVLVKLQPYRQHSLQLRKNQKLGMRHFGPFPIVERIGLVTYRLQLPFYVKIHPVFHVLVLKPFRGDDLQPYFLLPITTSNIGPFPQLVEIFDSRCILRGTT